MDGYTERDLADALLHREANDDYFGVPDDADRDLDWPEQDEADDD